MTELYTGRDWLSVTPGNKPKKAPRQIKKVDCPGCGEPVAITNVKQHAWSKRCVALADEKRLLKDGWVRKNKNWGTVFEDAGVEIRTARKEMVPGWAAMIFYSCRAANLRKPPLAHWIRSIAGNDSAIHIMQRIKFYADIHQNKREVSEIAFIALQGDIDILVALGVAKHSKLGYKTMLLWLNKIIEQMQDGIIPLEENELDELSLTANKAALYAEKFNEVHPGKMTSTFVNYHETIIRRSQTLRDLCKRRRP